MAEPRHADGSVQTSHQAGQTPHIGIIGAGLAGLRCADILLQQGFRVTILEGRDRIGGRLYQDRLANGHVIDVGPNWIHGTEDNPILELARETNTATWSWESASCVYDEDGRPYAPDEGAAYSTMMWDIVQAAFRHSNKHSADIDPGESLLDFFRAKLRETIPETTEGWRRKRDIVLQMADLWGAFVGSPVEQQSLKFFWLEECIDGENLYCAGTYAKILERIAAPALEGATVRYGAVVAKIHARAQPADDGPVRVTLATGAQLAFDELVVTCPLGWLQRNPGAFEPPLPAHLTRAINSISYGCLEKVYISFPRAFWLASGDGADVAGNESSHQKSRTPRTMTGFAQWLAPRFAPETNPSRWTVEVLELASLAAPGSSAAAHPTLLFYTYGAQSAHLVAQLAALPTQPQRDAFLCAFFAPYYARLPGYAAADPGCRPTCCYATAWLADDLAGRGSYANFQVGLETGDADIRAMRDGWPAAGVWLAGEHTAPFVALGTATGAYWSGESVARRVGEAYRKGAGGERDEEAGKSGEAEGAA